MPDQYEPPKILFKRFQQFDQRWELREQFQEIISLMQGNQEKLRHCIQEKKTIRRKEMETLLREMEEFRVWSWKEADRDDYFYNTIIEFDKKCFELFH
jgi:hypothetical protein